MTGIFILSGLILFVIGLYIFKNKKGKVPILHENNPRYWNWEKAKVTLNKGLNLVLDVEVDTGTLSLQHRWDNTLKVLMVNNIYLILEKKISAGVMREVRKELAFKIQYINNGNPRKGVKLVSVTVTWDWELILYFKYI